MASDPDWPVSFEAASADHLRRWAATTPAERLRWLESAARLALQTGALPRRDEDNPTEQGRETSTPPRS